MPVNRQQNSGSFTRKRRAMITVGRERGKWTAKLIKRGKVILVYRTRTFTHLLTFLAINKPEGI